MVLIIAEKPSLARNISSAVGNMTKRNGSFEGGNYIVTWAFGHLFSLCDIEHYSPAPEGKKGWCVDNLPCFPKKFAFELKKAADGTPDAGVLRQFENIKQLCRREDVDTIINAGDSDREGEIIIRIIIDHAFDSKEEKEKKQLLRLWMPDQTPQTILDGLKSPPPESEYDSLAYEGYARTFIDWLYGVNLTRYATLKTGRLLRVGRVIVPIVKAIYDRDTAIRRFVPDIYYGMASAEETKGEKIELVSKKKFSKNEHDAVQKACAEYNAAGAVVTGVKRKKDKLSPGKLYSLTKLQNYLGRKYKMPMATSLEAVQKLYEDGYVTYPRTNSEYLATAEADKVKQVIKAVAGVGYPVTFRDGKSIFDDSKIESHSALTPTTKIPPKARLTEDGAKVYAAVIRRFVAVFCSEECIVDKTEIKIDVPECESFTLKGTVIVEPGWTKYDDSTVKDKVLPALKKGEEVSISFKPVEKETSPPKHYTIETLNNYLKNPFRGEEKSAEGADGDDEEYRAIFEGLELGTEATRTGIIENAKKSKYIQLKKDVYTILPDGEYLIESLSRMGIGMDKYKTADVGRALKKVYRRQLSINAAIAIAKQEIAHVFDATPQPEQTDTDDGFIGDRAGICPLCGGEVVRSRYGYGCNKYREGCKFRISGVICKRIISLANARLLLSAGETSLIEGFISKSGKAFSARLKLIDGEVKFSFD